MNRLFLLLELLIFGNTVILAQDTIKLDMSSVYALEITFNEIIAKPKCGCDASAYKQNKQRENCILYEIRVDSLLEFVDTTVYKKSDFPFIKYAVVPSTINIELDKRYLITASNSCSKKYIVIKNICEPNSCIFEKWKLLAYQIGLVECQSFTFWDKFRLSLGLGKENIYRKATKRHLENNELLKLIEEL